MPTIFLSNVNQYAGPGALDALCAQGHTVLCSDRDFADESRRNTFEHAHAGCTALRGQTPDDVHAEIMAKGELPDAAVCNDVHANTPADIESIPPDAYAAAFHALVLTPIRIAQLFLPAMKRRRRGSFVFVTSARELRPEPGYAVATTLRAATTTFAQALGKEAAPYGIQANVVAPNYLYSEMYYPKARFEDDASARDMIARTVPFGRLGRQDEVGALIAFLASGNSPFTTGQVIYFTGGWP